MDTALGTSSRADFGAISVAFGEGLLVPRPWTLLQSLWAAELSPGLAAGDIVELGCGAGHIGIAAAAMTDRPLVLVDDNPAACRWARRNAEANLPRAAVTTVCSDFAAAAATVGGRHPLLLADPPYVPRARVTRFPADPPHTIDGGADGLALVRRCIDAVAALLAPGGAAVLQVGGPEQARDAARHAATRGLISPAVRTAGPDRALVQLVHA